jgi:RNA polymerase sigma factor (sigma-70 family)
MIEAANDNRPAWYDAQLLAYTPFIEKMANRAYPNGNADELVQEIYLLALRKWDRYNQSYKFGTWLIQLCRNVVSERKHAASRKKRAAVHVTIDATGIEHTKHVAIDPSQHSYAELSEALRRLSGTRDSDALMRLAMGDELQDVAIDMGISRERVRQLAARERVRLVGIYGEAA